MTKAEAQDCWDDIVTDRETQSRTHGTRSGSNRNGIRTRPTTIRCSVRVAPAGFGASTSGIGSSSCPSRVWLGARRHGRSGSGPPAGSDTPGRAGGGDTTACQHAAVRRADRCGHGDRRHRGRSAVRRGAGRGGGRPAHAPRRLPVGDRTARPRRTGRRFAVPPGAGEHQFRAVARRGPAGDRRGMGVSRFTTSGDPPRSGCRRSVADSATDCTSAKTRLCSNASTRTAHRWVPTRPAARTLATGLANRTFPFIRYDLGDDVTLLPGPCECGSAFARVADIGGRRDDDFRYGSITVPAITFRHVLGTDPRISEYQVVQTATGAEILAVGRPDVDALTSVGGRRTAPLWFAGPDGRDPGRRPHPPPPGERQTQALHRPVEP